jgi:hypothetical protein
LASRYLHIQSNPCTNWLPFTCEANGYNHRSNRFSLSLVQVTGHDRCYDTITNRWQKALQNAENEWIQPAKDDIVRATPGHTRTAHEEIHPVYMWGCHQSMARLMIPRCYLPWDYLCFDGEPYLRSITIPPALSDRKEGADAGTDERMDGQLINVFHLTM